MDNELQFNEKLDQFSLEKLKLFYIASLNKLNNQEKTNIDINYCQNCRNKLKNIKIELKDNEIICDHCHNKNICNLFTKISELCKEIDIDYFCPYFIPHSRYL